MNVPRILALVIGGWLVAGATTALAQSFGVELHNTLMPASGAMGGVSLSQPQDVTSAINGNPATLSQFRGTQFLFGGAWIEPTMTLAQSNQLPVFGSPLIFPFAQAKSTAPGAPAGNIGVTQELMVMDVPMTLGLGFITASGAAADFRHVPASNGTNTGLTMFEIPVMLGVNLTERLSVGAGVALGIALFDAPFVGVSGMTSDYALRGTLGANYNISDATSLGVYFQTEQSFNFDNAVLINPGPGQSAFDVRMDLPQNLGLGLANRSLMDGQLLLAADLLYKRWDTAALFDQVYDNQWVVQLGAQLTAGAMKVRAGYVWAQDPMDQTPGPTLGGITPIGGLPAVRYTQARLAVSGQHRISAGVGMSDVMPGLDVDLAAGGMFHDSEQLGPFTTSSLSSYWIVAGLTWRFGACCPSEG